MARVLGDARPGIAFPVFLQPCCVTQRTHSPEESHNGSLVLLPDRPSLCTDYFAFGELLGLFHAHDELLFLGESASQHPALVPGHHLQDALLAQGVRVAAAFSLIG